jgi:hypothetical protein
LSKEEDEGVFVDPSSLTVAISHGEMVILPVDCAPERWVEAVSSVLDLSAWPLPDGRVLVKRD